MIHGLKVRNYKSLRDIEVEFGNLTVLVGENNSGKSALFESLLYLKQAEGVQYGHDVRAPEFVGHSFDFETIPHRNEGFQAESVSIIPSFDYEGKREYEDVAKLLDNKGVWSDPIPRYIWIGMEMHRGHWLPKLYLGTVSEENNIIEAELSEDDRYDLEITFKDENGSSASYSTNGVYDLLFRSGTSGYDGFFADFYGPASEELDKIHYISDMRDIDKPSADPSEHDFVGYQGENTVAWLHALRDNEDVFQRITEAVTKIAPDVADVRADMHGSDTKTELADADTKELFNIVTSGAGLRRLLPIIVQIAAAEEGDTIIIEEPEIGVYPKTQERLVEFILDSIREQNIQVLVSTHGIPLTWKIQNMADTEMGHALKFKKEGGETIIDEYDLDRIPVEEYYGEQ